MKHENFWSMFAAASASVMVIGGAATAALAQPPQATTTVFGERDLDDIRTVRVSYRDLNLASASHERILYRRVGHAAREVCTRDEIWSYDDIGFAPCVRGARRDAKPQIVMAVKRAQQIALTGASSIPMVAIAIVAR